MILPGQRSSFVHNLFASFISWIVKLNLKNNVNTEYLSLYFRELLNSSGTKEK